VHAQGTRVNAPGVTGGYVGATEVGSGGQRVFYAAWQTTLGKLEVHDVPLDGTQATRILGAPLGAGRSCSIYDAFRVAPDESHLAYLADQDVDEQYELYVVPTDGSRVSTKLSGVLIANGDVQPGYQWTPDGARVVYRADATQDSFTHLFSVRGDGSAPPVQLHAVATNGFLVTGDSARAVFAAGGTLYSVRVDGSAAAVALSGALTDAVEGYALTPDGARVVFTSSTFVGEASEQRLLSAPVDGSSPAVVLVGPFLDDQFFGPPSFLVTGDSARALFLSPVDGQLWSAPVDGSAPAEHLNALPSANTVTNYRASPDGSTVVFGNRSAGLSRLYSVPADHSSAALQLAGPTSAFLIQADVGAAGRAVFVLPTAGVHELYSVPLDASQAPVKLSGPMVAGGDITGFDGVLPTFRFSPDGGWVIYTADQDTDEMHELFSVPIDGSSAAAKLNGALVAGGDAGSAQFVLGSRRLVYHANQAAPEPELYVAAWRNAPPIALGNRGGRSVANPTPATVTAP
jgi:Tol biopolymer transport system component